jgi:beta-lactamase regulating signal transducer with metallopeptidase domain
MVFSAANAAEVFVSVLAFSIAATALAFLTLWCLTRAPRLVCAANRYLAWLSLAVLCAALPLVGFGGAFAHRYTDITTTIPRSAPAPHVSRATSFGRADFDPGNAAAQHPNVIEPSVTPRHPISLTQVLATIWAIGTLLLLLRIAVRLRAALALKRGTPYTLPHDAARAAGVVYSEAVGSPVAIGYFRPAIVLPPQLAGDEFASVREHALAHENAHLRRYDDFTALLYQLCIAIAWWNPIVWLISTSLAAEREKACDDAVVLQTQEAKAYGLSLISLCRGSSFARPDHVLALFEARERLADRIESIVTARPRSLHPRTGAALCCVLLALAQSAFALSVMPGFALAANARIINLPPLSQPRADHVAVLLNDGTVLIAGGLLENGKFLASAEVYDPRSREFTPVEDMHVPRAGAAAAVLANGEVLIAGGYTPHGVTTSTEFYDPATRTFRDGPSMDERRADETATVLRDGRVLFTGGEIAMNRFTDCSEIYNPQDNSFAYSGSMHASRAEHTATLLRDGTVLIAGGSTRGNDTLADAEIYNPVDETFTPVGAMTAPRTKHSATLLPDGRVLIAGGGTDYSWQHVQRSAEVYDPKAQTFTRIADMNDPRFKDAASTIAMPDGSVLFAGGSASIERFDTKRMQFELVGWQTSIARHFATATLLRDGSVLVAGGYGNNLQTSASSQLVVLN